MTRPYTAQTRVVKRKALTRHSARTARTCGKGDSRGRPRRRCASGNWWNHAVTHAVAEGRHLAPYIGSAIGGMVLAFGGAYILTHYGVT